MEIFINKVYIMGIIKYNKYIKCVVISKKKLIKKGKN